MKTGIFFIDRFSKEENMMEQSGASNDPKQTAESPSRRKVLKKAVYIAPTLISLGTLSSISLGQPPPPPPVSTGDPPVGGGAAVGGPPPPRRR